MATLSPDQVALKPASERDVDTIVALAERIWRIHYPPIIGAEQVEYMLSNMHQSQHVKDQMKKGASFFFIEENERTIGYVATSKPESGQLFIHKFYIDPNNQGHGIGKRVFKEIVELNPDVTVIRLTVNRMNYKSINFYYRVGFVIEEVKDFDIGNGYFMNDFIMKWEK
jgi:RimJ/RimL family protein N-acetyltransferase